MLRGRLVHRFTSDSITDCSTMGRGRLVGDAPGRGRPSVDGIGGAPPGPGGGPTLRESNRLGGGGTAASSAK